MELQNTLVKCLNLKEKLDTNKNKGEVELFLCLDNIKINDLWKKESFYLGAADYLKDYMNKKWTAFMSELFNKSSQWFTAMEKFMKFPDGEELYYKYGHTNLTTYITASPEEREYIMKYIRKYPTSTFYGILYRAGMRGKVTPNTKNETTIAWKEKYNTLEKEYKALQKKYKKLERKNKSITLENKSLKGQVADFTKQQKRMQSIIGISSKNTNRSQPSA